MSGAGYTLRRRHALLFYLQLPLCQLLEDYVGALFSAWGSTCAFVCYSLSEFRYTDRRLCSNSPGCLCTCTSSCDLCLRLPGRESDNVEGNEGHLHGLWLLLACEQGAA